MSLKDEDIFNKTLPAKVQNYMANGFPLLASANGEIPRVIALSKSGFSVDAGDAESLAELIYVLKDVTRTELDELSKKNYEYSIKNFDKESIVQQFIRVIKEKK